MPGLAELGTNFEGASQPKSKEIPSTTIERGQNTTDSTFVSRIPGRELDVPAIPIPNSGVENLSPTETLEDKPESLTLSLRKVQDSGIISPEDLYKIAQLLYFLRKD